MRPFTIYHTHLNLFVVGTEKLVELVQQVINPDVIYLLGATLNRQRTESIFNQTAPTAQFINNYYLLVLINETQSRPLHEWQEMIEQKCAQFKETVVIVLTTKTFNEWLETGHRFARLVDQNAVKLLKADKVALSATGAFDEKSEAIEIVRLLNRGKYMAEEFLAGAEVYIARKNYNIAAFMLHQAMEQAFSTLLKVETGYEQRTHNIIRLMKYEGLLNHEMKNPLSSYRLITELKKDILSNVYYETRYNSRSCFSVCATMQLYKMAKSVIKCLFL